VKIFQTKFGFHILRDSSFQDIEEAKCRIETIVFERNLALARSVTHINLKAKKANWSQKGGLVISALSISQVIDKFHSFYGFWEYPSSWRLHQMGLCESARMCIRSMKDTGARFYLEPYRWGNDGGMAVAVKVDSRGRPVSYMSLEELSNEYNWFLPAGFHYLLRN
jgi:hypothetical protein